MNSIRTIHTAINYEIARQFEILKNGGAVQNETRAADSEGRTVSMRDKETEETDYRFMVEPNLPQLKIHGKWLKEVEEELKCEGKADFEVLREDVGFDARSAVHIAVSSEKSIKVIDFRPKNRRKRNFPWKNR